jgi:hypothetical protein
MALDRQEAAAQNSDKQVEHCVEHPASPPLGVASTVLLWIGRDAPLLRLLGSAGTTYDRLSGPGAPCFPVLLV